MMETGISISQIQTWLNLLKQFIDKGHSSLNTDKVADVLHLTANGMVELLELTFEWQKIFHSILPGNSFIKVRKNNTWYLILSPRLLYHTEIQISNEEINILNDIIYYFQHIAKGKGFNTRYTTTELLKKLKNLYKIHPYFFERRGNGLIYPSSLALSVGSTLEKYNRTNKDINCISVEEYLIRIT
ncbi:MAG: hypothetical protein ACFE9R_01065 [Candidatus Hermodarchaeota archaeon]